MKISGHKHTFEAQSASERDGWFVAVEKAITEAKAAKEGIESSEGYKENKERIGKLLHRQGDLETRFVASTLVLWQIWLFPPQGADMTQASPQR